MPDEGQVPGLRSPWSRSDRVLPRKVIKPLQTFLSTEAAGGILVLGAAIAALVWANSPWGDTYERFWHIELSLHLGDLSLSEDLRHWVNDALMAIFFFVVGLEIKRELVTGELRDPRAAMFPALGALGGMVLPAGLYAILNAGGDGSAGWGVPMATDIAFAVGILALVGRGLPPTVKLFLLTLAIVDDIGAIAVIAIFYSGGVSWAWLGTAVGLLLLIVVMQRLNIRAVLAYIAVGAFVWLAVFESGVHATIAGVALGLLTPAFPFQRPGALSAFAHRVADKTSDEPSSPDADAHEWLDLASLSREGASPLARLEHMLHPWSSYVIVPLFALANAGVRLDGDSLRDAASSRITLGIILGLVVGKTLGITLIAWLGTKTGIARMPAGVRWDHIFAVSAVAGIGFTVSLFIAQLAFDDTTLAAAKVGVLAASVVAGSLGAFLVARARAKTKRLEGMR